MCSNIYRLSAYNFIEAGHNYRFTNKTFATPKTKGIEQIKNGALQTNDIYIEFHQDNVLTCLVEIMIGPMLKNCLNENFGERKSAAAL